MSSHFCKGPSDGSGNRGKSARYVQGTLEPAQQLHLQMEAILCDVNRDVNALAELSKTLDGYTELASNDIYVNRLDAETRSEAGGRHP